MTFLLGLVFISFRLAFFPAGSFWESILMGLSEISMWHDFLMVGRRPFHADHVSANPPNFPGLAVAQHAVLDLKALLPFVH